MLVLFSKDSTTSLDVGKAIITFGGLFSIQSLNLLAELYFLALKAYL